MDPARGIIMGGRRENLPKRYVTREEWAVKINDLAFFDNGGEPTIY